jgi:predicted nucleic acid-binding protein
MNDLAQVPSGTRIFVDASVLALHFTDHPELGPPCRDFLERCASHEIEGYTSPFVAVMMRHRMHHLATHDRDFARLPSLHVWRPASSP